MDICIGLILLVAVTAIVMFLISAATGRPPAHPEPAMEIPLLTRVEAQAIIVSPLESMAYLYPTGREIFFPRNAAPGYEITLTGILQAGTQLSDALYSTDTAGNFAYGVDWLRVNGSRMADFQFQIISSDRCEHRYIIRIDAPSGRRLTLALDHNPRWNGCLCVEVRALREGTPLISELRRQARERYDADRESTEFARKFSTVIQELCTRAELFRNWGDVAFREQFARSRGPELVRREQEIRSEASDLLEQHHIVAYLRRHNPVVLDRLLGQFETLLIAERLAIQPKEEPKPLPPPRPRLSIEEVRERMCRRIEVQGGDRQALMATILTQKQEQIDMLEQFSLSDDEREQQVREIEDWAAGQLMKLNEGKETCNANYQTIG